LLSLLPLVLVRKSSNPSFAAANGQFMLFQAEIYQELKPHEAVKNSKAEDIEISKLFKRKNKKVACLVGNHEITCRMYENFNEAVNGFSRNVIMYFGNSFVLATLFWLVTSSGFIVVYISFSLSLFFLWLTVTLLTRIIISVISNQPVVQNLVLAIPQQVTLGIFIFKAFTKKFKNQYTWKGRNIS
jgi:ABC-type multidrug transport system fused ATPase/permease subunit